MKSTTGRFILFVCMPALIGMLSLWGIIHQYGFANAWLPFIAAASTACSLALIAWVLSIILRYYRPTDGKEWMLALWILIFSFAWLLLLQPALMFFLGSDIQFAAFLKNTFWIRFFMANLVLTCVALITWLNRQRELEYKQKERYNETQKLARDAELNSIRQQLQPHFLFNSLNSIYALIGTEPGKARSMVQNLSEFLRGTLRRDSAQMVDLQEELLHTKLYLEIEKVRFPRLHIKWETDEDCESLKMPVLLLQPLVENAIKFGLYDVTEDVEIAIQVSCENQALKLVVSNPYDRNTAASNKGTGFGLDSIRRRLYLLFGRNDLLKISMTENIFSAAIIIPQNT